MIIIYIDYNPLASILCLGSIILLIMSRLLVTPVIHRANTALVVHLSELQERQ